MKKILLLFFALLLPLLIFFFLKTFGKNEFDVPVLFADSVTAPVACNLYTYQAPYVIPDSILKNTSWNNQDSLTIYVFEDGDKEKKHERSIHVTRIFEQFENVPLRVVCIYKQDVSAGFKASTLTSIGMSGDDFNRTRNCVFLLSPENDAVIVDRQKRIRGQYNLSKRQDADRMIMEEMNILLKRY